MGVLFVLGFAAGIVVMYASAANVKGDGRLFGIFGGALIPFIVGFASYFFVDRLESFSNGGKFWVWRR
jgi:hypothetical protein